jgi:hypothetical protein
MYDCESATTEHHENKLLEVESKNGMRNIEARLSLSRKKLTQTVIIIGKGGSAKPVKKTPDNVIVTINHALGFQEYADIHFHLDWYFDVVPTDFFCRAKALVMPTYFHYCGLNGKQKCLLVHASLWLSKLRFDGPIFLVQLPDGPIDPDIEMWSGKETAITSGDLAFAWMLARGYRNFESYGFGGNRYANYYISGRYRVPQVFTHSYQYKYIRLRIKNYAAEWKQHLEPQTSDTMIKIDLGPCIHDSGWGMETGYGPTILEAQELGAGDPGVNAYIVLNNQTKAYIPTMKWVSILMKDSDSFDKDDIIISINAQAKRQAKANIHFQLEMPKDYIDMIKADILVTPTYMYDGTRFVPVDDVLWKINFTGPIFKIQLQDGPQKHLIERVHSNKYYAIAREWMFKRGYRNFRKLKLNHQQL